MAGGGRLSITRSLTRPLTAPLTRAITDSVAGGSLPNTMVVELTSDYLFARYPWDATYDAVQRIARNITPGALFPNGCAGPNGIRLIPIATARTDMVAAFNAASSSQIIADEGDSVGPMKYNGTFIAGIHGTNAVRQVTAAAHGKTVGDIGSQWTSPDAVTYWLISIRDANTLWFLAANIGIDAELWRYQSSMTASGTMTYVTGATNTANISYSANSIVQLVPCVQDHTCAVKLNGTTTITASGVYDCRYAQVVETYGIANTADMLAWMIAGRPWSTAPATNDNAIATQVLCEYTYEIHDNGSMRIPSRFENLQKIDLARSAGYIGLTQANAPYWHTPGSAEKIHLSVPRVNPIVGGTKTWDYAAGEDISGTVDTLEFAAATWTDALNPPDCAAYYVTTTATGIKRRGFGLGYSRLSGQGLNLPASVVSSSGQVSSGRKFYPKIITPGAFGSAPSLLPAGTIVEATAWRAPYNLDPIPEVTCAAVVQFDEGRKAEIRLIIHETVSGYSIPVPTKFNGKSVSIVHSSGVLTLDSAVVTAGAITVSAADGEATLLIA